MTISEVLNEKNQADLQRLRNFRLFDDDFMTKCFEGNTECIELVLQIVLNILKKAIGGKEYVLSKRPHADIPVQ